MGLSVRHGLAEEERKNAVFAARKFVEDAAEKELHCQRLIAENIELKIMLLEAKVDIEDWLCSYSNLASEKLVSKINEIL